VVTGEIDLERARAETLGTRHGIHLNAAGSALSPFPVLEAIRSYLDLEADAGGYEAEDAGHAAISDAYASLAVLLGASVDEIAIGQSGTWALTTAIRAIDWQPGDVLLTSGVEYSSAWMTYLELSRTRGVAVEVLPDDPTGEISLDALEERLAAPARAIALAHVPCHVGLVQPIAAVGRLVRQSNVLFLVDAAQSVGVVPLDVHEIGCTVLAGTGRKGLRGPRGTGFMYIRKDALPAFHPSVADYGKARVCAGTVEWDASARKFEYWESSRALTVGLGAAARYALGMGVPGIWARVTKLGSLLADRLESIPRVRVYRGGRQQAGIVGFTVDGIPAARVRTELSRRGVAVGINTPLGTPVAMQRLGVEALVRASVHYYTTEDDIETLIATMRAITPPS
jgi:cysteine desulfurase / selenocysteine lyase